jgi:hypothetical protein
MDAWHICILTRMIFVVIVLYFSIIKFNWYVMKVLGILGLFPALGFIIIWLFQLRKSGFEVSTADKHIWWDDMRPVHALNYFVFSMLALSVSPHAYAPLLFDVGIGLGGFVARINFTHQ